MGIVSSCLGSQNKSDDIDEDESSRLLYGDNQSHQYGSFGDQNVGIVQADPQEVQRETEALQKVVAQTSNHLVDIFAMVPQNAYRGPPTIYPDQDPRLLKYQDVLAKLYSQHQPSPEIQLTSDNPQKVDDGWMSEEDETTESSSYKRVKSDDIGPLLGGFADVDSAMK
ncbi:late endosomal/lysosomal adaptor and MAPK and MTOR activator-domain-containing protein [Xylogone sp. PMI_703]|nr:late endosomal/lysosomal adaptor and MAPK and MTOR activator-domain-containing protein [Xylogone sp. PMI_703]